MRHMRPARRDRCHRLCRRRQRPRAHRGVLLHHAVCGPDDVGNHVGLGGAQAEQEAPTKG